MLATFCVRLALGLIIWLPLVWSCLPHPRFVRTQFLTALGLLAIAAASSWEQADAVLRCLLLVGTALALGGAIAWTFDPAPAGRLMILVLDGVLIGAMNFLEGRQSEQYQYDFVAALHVAFGLISALLLGAAVSAMLVGHSYLIAPGLALTPLQRIHKALFASLALRGGLAAWALWTIYAAGATLTSEALLWLPVRWLVGIAGTLGFGLMAYSAAKIRSTQSATGILYVVVICAIVGELLGMLLESQTGLPL